VLLKYVSSTICDSLLAQAIVVELYQTTFS